MMRPRSAMLYLDAISDVCDSFMTHVAHLLDEKQETPEDFQYELYKWALEAISVVALDTRLGILDINHKPGSEADQMIDATNKMFDKLAHLEFAPFPFWRFLPTKTWREFKAAADIFTRVGQKYLREAEERVKRKLALYDEGQTHQELTVLETMLTNPDLTPGNVLVMALDMLFAGIDTAVVKESMRLDPIATGTQRVMPQDAVIRGYLVPKGTSVFPFTFATRMNPKYFPEPEKFLPERFLRSGPKELSAPAFSYLPFGHGVRMCIGRRFAEMEMWILLSKLLRKYRVEWHYGELGMVSRMVNLPDKPLPFRLIPSTACFQIPGSALSYSGCLNSFCALTKRLNSSADVRYVRFRDDVPIPGSDCSELLVGPVPSQELGHVGVYHCEVRAEGFSVLSERMSLQFDDQPPGQPSPPSKIALLMGNMAYANETVLLRPKTDLKILREALSQAGFVVVALLDLTLKEMRNGLSLVADLIVPGAYVFFHFAGHGFIGGGEQYLMPIDSHRDGRECVSISDVQELFLAKDPGLCVLTLDTCRRRVDGSCFFRPRELKANTRNLVKLFSSSVSEYAREQLSFETTLFVKQLAKFLPQPKPLTEVLVQIWHGYASTDQVPTREINLQDSSKSLFDPIDWSRGEQRRLLDVCKEGMLQTNLLNTKVQDVEFSITFGPMLGFIANVYELAIEGDQARCFQLKHVSPDSIRAKLVTSSTNSRLKQWEVSRVATCKNLEVDSIELLMSFQKNPESEATELTCEVPLPVVWKGLCEPVEDAWWTDGSLRVDLETGGVSPCALLSLLIASSATGNPGLALKKEEK
ncbi:unnamed protein product, partial [Cyprideis torosa]